MGDDRQFYESAYPTPIEVTGIGNVAQPLFVGSPSKYWTDIKIIIETMGSNSALYLGDQVAQFDLIGTQAYQYISYSLNPGQVFNVARFWILGTSGNNDGKVWVTGLDPQIVPTQVINPFTRI
jgi:hypothetical protein